MYNHGCIDVHRNTVHTCIAPLLHSHNPRLVGPVCCCWGFTSLFVSPWLLWSPIRTPSPLIGLPDVRRRFTLVMYWSGPEGCACVCVDVSVCLYELVFYFFFFCSLWLHVLWVCVFVCGDFFIVCQQTLLAPAHAPGCKHFCWTAKQWPCM